LGVASAKAVLEDTAIQTLSQGPVRVMGAKRLECARLQRRSFP